MHRFAVPELDVRGHDPAQLRKALEYLRRNRYELLSLGDLAERLEKNSRIDRNGVVFTVDDGYFDFAEIAAPIFAAYDCPVTVFLITDFISGRLWNWFDRVAWAIRHSQHRLATFEVDGTSLAIELNTPSAREESEEKIVERLKLVPDSTKEHLIVKLAEVLGVALPTGVPDRDRAMTWDDVRRCARSGATFGAHTVSHPVLSRVDDARAEWEISESWSRVVAETDAAVPVFCYPNGTQRDFSRREEMLVARAGMKAALSTIEASIVTANRRLTAPDPFALPRFAYPETMPALIQMASGLAAMRSRVTSSFA